MKSKPYKLYGKMFRYDFDTATVEYISKADEEMRRDSEDWQAKYGKNLWDIDDDGYIVLSTVGLLPENWKNKAARDEHLFCWCCELDEESSAMARDFEKYELPYMTKKVKEEQK